MTSPKIGATDISTVVIAGGVGTPGVGQLPSVTTEAQLGEIVTAWDGTYGSAEFILLKVPAALAVPLGTLVQWDKAYTVAVVPVAGTSKQTGVSVALAYTAIAANATLAQYAWFVIQGIAPVLKTAVTIPAQSPLYISATAGRVKLIASTGQILIGARSANTASVTTTTSTVLVYLNRSALPGA
jgi:hypothetical protein